MIRNMLVTLIITAIAIAVTAAILGGVRVDGGIGTYPWLAVIFGLVNAILGPILRLISLPLTLADLRPVRPRRQRRARRHRGGSPATSRWTTSAGRSWPGLIMSIVMAILRMVLGSDDDRARGYA